MIRRLCVCGKPIPPNNCFCVLCREKYGMVRSKWESWLTFMVADLDREYKKEIEIAENETVFSDMEVGTEFRDE